MAASKQDRNRVEVRDSSTISRKLPLQVGSQIPFSKTDTFFNGVNSNDNRNNIDNSTKDVFNKTSDGKKREDRENIVDSGRSSNKENVLLQAQIAVKLPDKQPSAKRPKAATSNLLKPTQSSLARTSSKVLNSARCIKALPGDFSSLFVCLFVFFSKGQI